MPAFISFQQETTQNFLNLLAALSVKVSGLTFSFEMLDNYKLPFFDIARAHR